jgi:hypothetical protein
MNSYLIVTAQPLHCRFKIVIRFLTVRFANSFFLHFRYLLFGQYVPPHRSCYARLFNYFKRDHVRKDKRSFYMNVKYWKVCRYLFCDDRSLVQMRVFGSRAKSAAFFSRSSFYPEISFAPRKEIVYPDGATSTG